MTKLLRDILAAQEPLFTQSLRELEFLTGRKNIDIKLSAEITEKTFDTLRSLGLDANDTTDAELYHALDQRVRQNNINLAKGLGTSPKLVAAVDIVKMPRTAWVLKSLSGKAYLGKCLLK